MSAYDSQKQKPPQTRPVEVCVGCTKTKPIFTHLRGDPRLPLCNACNMKLRRESPEAQQIKLIKLCGTAMGTVQSILTLPLEGGDQEAIERMRDSLRAMLHRWSAEQQPEQDEAATSVTTKQGETAATAVPASAVNIDELPPEARARVIAKINVPAASPHFSNKK